MNSVTISRLPCGVSTSTWLVTKANAYSPWRGCSTSTTAPNALRREGIDQHLDRRIEPAVDGHPEQELVAPGKHATAHDVARDRAHDQDDGDGGQEPQPRKGPAQHLLVHGGEDVVDPAPENPQEPRREEDGNRDEEAGDKTNLEPVPHGFSEDNTPCQRCRQSASARAGHRRRHPSRASDRPVAGAGGDGRGHRISPLGARRPARGRGDRGAGRAGHDEPRKPCRPRGGSTAGPAGGGLDVLVNSAAIFERTPFATTTAARYDRLLGLNLRAAFFCSQAAAAVMRRRGDHIVNIGAAGAAGPRPNYIP